MHNLTIYILNRLRILFKSLGKKEESFNDLINYLDINIDKINKNIRSIKIMKTAALDKSLIFFISVLNSSEILSDNFSIDVFSNSNANNKK